MVEYIEETPQKVKLDNICNEIQVHSHVHRLWGEFALYIVVLLTCFGCQYNRFHALKSSYKSSKMRLSSITKMGEIERAWIPMCGFGN